MNLSELSSRLLQLPEQEAVYFQDNKLVRKSYKEVFNDVTTVCNWMSEVGIQRGMRIGILAENCYEWVLCELACLNLGCVLVTFPPDEFAQCTFEEMADKYGLSILLVSKREKERRKAEFPWISCINEGWHGKCVIHRHFDAPQSLKNQSVFNLDSDIYTLVFSSGTTGRLKCILMSKRGTEELIDAYGMNYHFLPTDSMLVVLPLSNFQQRLMVYTAIQYGFSIYIADSPEFFRALKEMRPTILAGPPAFYEAVENRFRNLPLHKRMFLDTGGWVLRRFLFGWLRGFLLKKWFAPFHQAYGGRIRLMLTGAAAIRLSTLKLFENMGFPIYQVYGLTETGFVSWNLPGRNRSGSVGKLVFKDGASLAEDGEILVHYKYPQSVGYLNAEEDQARTYLGEKRIATGDIGYFDSDGYLYIAGRKKEIIVTQGGYKLQPEPIEMQIESCPDVLRAVLFGGGEMSILAVLVSLRNGSDPAAENRIRRHINDLNAKLHHAARIGRVVFTASEFTRQNGFLTRNLKLDRAAIYMSFRDQLLGLKDAQVSPFNPKAPNSLSWTERRIAAIWSEVLGLQQVQPQADFFALGGDSLLGMQVMSRIRSNFGVDLSLQVLFEVRTVRGLASMVVAGGESLGDGSLPPLEKVPRTAKLPLSFAQKRLWFLNQLAPDDTSYNILTGVRIEGPLDRWALERSIGDIVQRHESLRTCFISVQGEPHQVIQEEAKFEWEVVNVNLGANDEIQTTIESTARTESQKLFSLEQGPLVRGKLLRFAERDHALLLTMHHIVADGWSMGVLLREITHLYDGYHLGRQLSLPQLPVQYADCSVWQTKWLSTAVISKQTEYWKKHLAASPEALDLATDHPFPSLRTSRGSRQFIHFDAGIVRRLRELAQKESVTLYMLLLAAFDVLLHRYTGSNDILVGSPIAGRRHPATENLIGLFVNTLIIRTRIDAKQPFTSVLQQVRDVTLLTYANQDVPFEKLVEELTPQRDLSRNPLFQVMFVLQNAPLPVLKLGDAKLHILEPDTGTSQFELFFSLREADDEIAGVAIYSTDLFEHATIVRLIKQYEVLLHSIVEAPDQPVDELALISNAELLELKGHWSMPMIEPRQPTIVEALAAHANSCPDAAALISETGVLSYSKLQKRSEKVAHCLKARGVGPAAHVALCMEKSRDFLPAALGILRMGCVFIPVEPDEPLPRLRSMLEDSKAEWVLADEHLGSRFSFSNVSVLSIDSDLQDHAEQQHPAETATDDPGCILYRSGSSGQLEGVLVPRKALGSLQFAGLLAVKKTDRVALRVRFSLENECFHMFAALKAGACVVDLDRPQLSFFKLARLLQDAEVTVLHAYGGELEVIAEEFPWALKGIRRIVCVEGYGALQDLVGRLPAELQDCTYGTYGSTEIAGGRLMYSLNQLNHESAAVPLKQLASDTAFYLLDAAMKPVPAGIRGELFVSTDSLAEGYYGRPGETAARFVTNTVDQAAQKLRLFRTGKFARRREDGSLEFCAHERGEIVVRGSRIGFREIELALLQHPGLQDVAVLFDAARKMDRGSLVGLIVPAQDYHIVAEELQNFLRERLPEMCVPARFRKVDALPRTTGRELDRAALPAMLKEVAGDGRKAVAPYVAPQNEVQEQLAQIWMRLLNVDRVGIHDNFFMKGGHSLAAAQVVARIRDRFNQEISIREFFQMPTIAELAGALKPSTQEGPAAPRIQRTSRVPHCAVTSAADSNLKK